MDAYTRILRIFQVADCKGLLFFLHFSGFQNDSFYTSKWPILPSRMTHFAEQNGPFCDVKRPILEIGSVFLSDLYGFFTVSEAFAALELKKI